MKNLISAALFTGFSTLSFSAIVPFGHDPRWADWRECLSQEIKTVLDHSKSVDEQVNFKDYSVVGVDRLKSFFLTDFYVVDLKHKNTDHVIRAQFHAGLQTISGFDPIAKKKSLNSYCYIDSNDYADVEILEVFERGNVHKKYLQISGSNGRRPEIGKQFPGY